MNFRITFLIIRYIRHTISFLWIHTKVAVQYRGETILYLLGGLQPLIAMYVWIAVTANSTTDIDTPHEAYLTTYFSLIFLVRQMNPIWFPWLMSDDIRFGRIVGKLLRPSHPFFDYFGYHFSDTLIRGPIALLICFILFLIFDANVELNSISKILVFALALLGGILLNFQLNLLFGLSSFWLERTLSLGRFYHMALLFLGGAMVPMAFAPSVVTRILEALPFYYIVGFPVDCLIGDATMNERPGSFFFLFLWILFLAFVINVLWNKGIRRFTVAGQ